MTRLHVQTMMFALVCGAVGCDDAPPPPPPAGTNLPSASRPLNLGAPLKGKIKPLDQPGRHPRLLKHDGKVRRYLVYTPKGYDGATPMPLVLFLHGGGGNAKTLPKSQPGLLRGADQLGVIAVFPEGIVAHDKGFVWAHNTCPQLDKDRAADDVGFLRALIEKVGKELKLDAKRIYISGFSSGGKMTSYAGSQLSDILAGVIPVAGSIGCTVDGKSHEIDPPSHPLSVLILHGKKDPRSPYDGGAGEKDGKTRPFEFPPVSRSVAFWAEQGGCKDPQDETKDGFEVRKYTCDKGVEVSHIAIVEGGHAFPKKLVGEPAAKVIYEFVKRNPKQGG